MKTSVESALRFLNLTASGLLAGSLGFGESALTPGWEEEKTKLAETSAARTARGYFNAIAPLALATSVALAVAPSHRSGRRVLDAVSAIGLAGVLATTTLVTVPLNRKLDQTAPVDYPDSDSHAMVKNWSRAHAVRTALGISAFVCAAASMAISRKG